MKKPSPETLRRLRIAGINWGVFTLVFVVALYVWFPYDRAKEVAINVASTQGYDVEIESAGPSWGLGVTFKNIHVKTRPATGKPTRFTIDKVTVTTSLLGAVFSSSPSTTITLDGFGGRVEIFQSGASANTAKKGARSLEITARGVKMNEIPGIRETINMPVFGTLKLDLDIATATGKLADAKGSISFLCEACVAGDGKSPLKIEGNAFLGGGLTLPRVRIGDLGGEVLIDKGMAKLKGIQSTSPDGEVSLDGDVSLHDPPVNSVVNAYLRFKLSDSFLKSASTMQTILQMAGAAGRRPDGSYGLRIAGRLGAPAMSLSASSPFGAAGALPVRAGARPGIAPAYVPPPPASAAQLPPPPPPPPPPPADNSAPPPPPADQPPPPPPPPPPPDVQVRGAPPAPVTDEPAPAPAPAPDAPPPGTPPGEEAQ